VWTDANFCGAKLVVAQYQRIYNLSGYYHGIFNWNDTISSIQWRCN